MFFQTLSVGRLRDVPAMFNKRSLAAEDVQAVAPAKGFRSEMVDIFLNNELSSERSARVLRSAQEAGAQNVEDLQVRPETRNTHRDLLRKCFRNTKWPSLYHTKVRGWNQAKNSSEEYSLAILLPHKSLHSLLKVNTAEALLQQQAEILPDRPDLESHLHFLENELGLDSETTLLAGIWCDGVPFNSDRSMTLETISLNIFGQGNLRLPVAAFPKEFVAKEQTFEDLFEIIQWSFKHLATGILPSCRHDGRPFDKTDVYRKRLAGEELPLRAALAEFRADWSCYADVLRFPSWSSKGFICWRCMCTRADLKKFDAHTFAKHLGLYC